MNQIGIYLERQIIGMMTKYNFNIPRDVIIFNLNRLTNQIWKLIPMYENNENWQHQLSTVTIEVAGLNEIFYFSPNFLQALSKLEGLMASNVNFEIYRKTVFEIISLLQGLKKDGLE